MKDTKNRQNEQRKKLFLEGPIGKALFTLAVPITLGNILQTGYILTDAYWVGKIGAAAVAAVAISFPFTFLVIAMGSGLAVAGAILSAQYVGAGLHEKVNHVAAQTMLMVAITSVILGSIGFILSPSLLHLMGAEADVYPGALAFMRTSFVGMIFVFGYGMFQALMRGVGETRIPLIIVSGTVILNFALDPLFIYGWGPIGPHGVMGAALATLATQALASAIGIWVFLRGQHGIHLKWSDFKLDLPYVKKAFLLGYPGSIELSLRGLGPLIMSFLATSFGTATIAAYGVGSNILQEITVPAMGLSMAVSTLVGQNLGAGNPQRASRVAVLGATTGLGLLSVVGVIAFVFADTIVQYFVHDPVVIASSAQFVRIMCLSWGCIGVQLCIISVFRASGKMMISMGIAIVSQLIFQFPLALALSKYTSLQAVGLWWSFPVANVLTAVVSVIWFTRGDWKKSRLTREIQEVTRVTDTTLIEESVH